MKKIDDRLWSAYLDGELTVSEIEKMEVGLTGQQLEHLRKEKVFEEKITHRLEEGILCPDELWESISTRIDKENKKSPRKIIYLGALLAAAACMTVFFFLNKNITSTLKVPLTLKELESSSKTTAALIDVNQFLKAKNIDLQLTEFRGGAHSRKVIGAGIERIGNEDVVTLLFNCCGFPVKIYVLPRGSAAERVVQAVDANWQEGLEGQVKRGQYRLALLSKHSAMDVLEAIVPT